MLQVRYDCKYLVNSDAVIEFNQEREVFFTDVATSDKDVYEEMMFVGALEMEVANSENFKIAECSVKGAWQTGLPIQSMIANNCE